MRTIALLLATVQATKLASKTSTKTDAEWNWNNYGSMTSDLTNMMQNLQNQGWATQADMDQFNSAMSNYNSNVNDYNNATGGDWDSQAITATAGSCADNDYKLDDWGDACIDYEDNKHWCGHTWAAGDFDSYRDCCACQ